MNADAFFASVETQQVMRSPWAQAHYGVNIRELTHDEAQEAICTKGRRLSQGGVGLCPVCNEWRPITVGHAKCGPCRKKHEKWLRQRKETM